MKVAFVVVAVLALATTVIAGEGELKISEENGKFNWELFYKGKSVLKSDAFPDRNAAVASGVTLLATGGNKDTCKATFGSKKKTEQQQQDVKLSPAAKVDCGKVEDAVEDIVKKFVATHSKGEPIGQTGLKFTIAENQSKDIRFFFNLKAANGEIVLASQQYKSEENARKGIASVLLNGGVKRSYNVKPTKDSKFSFNIKALNNKIVGASETYESKQNAERGRDGVRDKVREVLKAIVDPTAGAKEQQPKREQQPQKEQPKQEQQAQKKKEQPSGQQQQQQQQLQGGQQQNGQPQVNAVQLQAPQPQGVTPQQQPKGQQQEARDDNDVSDDSSDDDDGDDDADDE